MLPEKILSLNYDDLKVTGSDKFSNLPLKDYYAILLKSAGNISFEDLLNFSYKLGSPLMYGDKPYYTFDSIFYENELHYDGISADGKRIIPDWLIFYVEDTPAAPGGDFRVLNCETVVRDMNSDLIEFLENTDLEFYGFPTYFEPSPNPYDLTFKIKSIQTEKGKKVLRIHLPTSDPEYMFVERDYVYCKIDDFRIKFSGKSGKESDEIFSLIREYCFKDKHLFNITFQNGDILFMNNKYTFHGRDKCIKETSRLMHRIQIEL